MAKKKKQNNDPDTLLGVLESLDKSDLECVCNYKGKMENIAVIPTGSISLDKALGVGGLPVGRVVEIYGPESGGKTTLSLGVIAESQKMGKKSIFIDMEHAFDPVLAEGVGVDLSKVSIIQPNCGEQAFDLIESFSRSKDVNLIVVDSVASLVPKVELEGRMEDQQMGLQARMMGKGLRKISAIAAKSKITIIFINQMREKIGVMFGSNETTPGGKALKFYSSVRIKIQKIATIKDEGLECGNRVRMQVVKNKCAPPFRVAEADLIFGEGIDKIIDIIEFAAENDIISKNGTWYSYGEEKLGQGKQAVKEYLLEKKKLLDKIEKECRDAFKSSVDNAISKNKKKNKSEDDLDFDDNFGPGETFEEEEEKAEA